MFQSQHGLSPHGYCDENTWSALVETSWAFGSRLLYLTSPNLRGDDVATLQHQLARLGFDCGKVDGICGSLTIHAMSDFQHNYGLAIDGICGPETVRALDRVAGHSGDGPGIATVREYEEFLRGGAFGVTGSQPRIVLAMSSAHPPQLLSLIQHISRKLRSCTDQILIVDDTNANSHVRAANTFNSHVFVSIGCNPGEANFVAYYETENFVSRGGRSLANIVATKFDDSSIDELPVVAMRLPVLRETRMSAIACNIADHDHVVSRWRDIGDTLANAISIWISSESVGRRSSAARNQV